MTGKLYGTLGPACADTDTLRALLRAGMRGVRLNLSHGPLEERAPWLESLRRAETAEGVSCDLLIDLQGPELRVGAISAPLTLREEKFVALMHQCAGCAEIVPLPCPELVEFVERGELDSPALTAYLARQLGPYAGRVDAAVLGCTHFPFARRAIRAALGGNVQRIAAAGDGGLGEVGQGDTADLLTGDVDDHGEGAALVFGQIEAQRGDDGQQHDRQRHNEHKRDGDGQSFLLHVTFSSPKFCSKLPMSNSTVPGAARNH